MRLEGMAQCTLQHQCIGVLQECADSGYARVHVYKAGMLW